MFSKNKRIKFISLFHLFLWMGLLWFDNLSAQVQMSVDTTHIRIGEQFEYTLTTNNTSQVVFPDFKKDVTGKIEIIQSVPVATLKNRLYKKYILTSFDSGAYYIPAQEVFIDNQKYITDSLLIHVGTVKVDTTKQGLFPAKPIYKAPPKTWHEYLWILWWILGILFIVLLLWWLVFNKKTFAFVAAKKQLTPYQTALEELKKLDAQHFLAQQKIKEYYTALTDIIRKYMETDMKISAMETTSDELILLVKKENIHKKLGLTQNHITQLQAFLQHSDLVKFAKAKPEFTKMQEDRDYTIQVLQDLNRVIGEYETKLQQQNKTQNTVSNIPTTHRKRSLWVIIMGILVILITIGGFVGYYGLQYAKDTLVGHPSKELLEGKWYKSSYGYPAVTLESPVILKPVRSESFIGSNVIFEYHSLIDHFKINVSTFSFNENIPVNLEQVTAQAKSTVENIKGVEKLQFQTENITVSGIPGVKIFATFEVEKIPVQITELLFINGKNLVDMSVMRKQNDNYAAQIEKRMLSSVQIENVME